MTAEVKGYVAMQAAETVNVVTGPPKAVQRL